MAKISKSLLRKEINSWMKPQKMIKRKKSTFGSYMNEKYNFQNTDLESDVSKFTASKIILNKHVKEL